MFRTGDHFDSMERLLFPLVRFPTVSPNVACRQSRGDITWYAYVFMLTGTQNAPRQATADHRLTLQTEAFL